MVCSLFIFFSSIAVVLFLMLFTHAKACSVNEIASKLSRLRSELYGL
jgi:hypothetical protein